MRVFLDGIEIPLDRQSVAAALECGRRAAEERGRIVIEATLDGEALAPDVLENPGETDPGPVEVRLVTAEPRALVTMTMYDVADALEGAKQSQERAAGLVQSGSIEAALSELGGALEVWGHVRQVVEHGAALLKLNLDAEAAEGGGVISERAHGLASHLAEVKRCIEARDWSGLADELEFEMGPQAAAWQAVLRGLAGRIRSGA